MSDLVQTFQEVGIFSPQRRLETILPDCVIEEQSSDRLVITEHPVEQGASISDHAYKLPSEVTLRYGFTSSLVGNNTFQNLLGGNFGALVNFDQLGNMGVKYVRDTYEKLLKLQESRTPFDIITGKRDYKNMLIASLDITTDHTTEFTLMVVIHCREVIIVETITVDNVPASAPAPAPEQAPDTTGEANKGAQTPTPKPNSILKNLLGGGAKSPISTGSLGTTIQI